VCLYALAKMISFDTFVHKTEACGIVVDVCSATTVKRHAFETNDHRIEKKSRGEKTVMMEAETTKKKKPTWRL